MYQDTAEVRDKLLARQTYGAAAILKLIHWTAQEGSVT